MHMRAQQRPASGADSLRPSHTSHPSRPAPSLPPHSYDPVLIATYWERRPLSVAKRILQLGSIAGGFLSRLAWDVWRGETKGKEVERAIELREIVTSLGPAYIKLGQALSIRPDLLSPAVRAHKLRDALAPLTSPNRRPFPPHNSSPLTTCCAIKPPLPSQAMRELQKLCDKVPSFPNDIAMKLLEEELGGPWTDFYSELGPNPVAAASLGQVYKGKIKGTGETVAVKVQRPYVLARRLSGFPTAGLLPSSRGALLAAFSCPPAAATAGSRSLRVALASALLRLAPSLFPHGTSLPPHATTPPQETVTIDLYILRRVGVALRSVPQVATDVVGLLDEWASRFFEELDYVREGENATRFAADMAVDLPQIVVPKTYSQLTSRRVLTSEWLEGEKLSQSAESDVGELVKLGVICFLKQLLDTGFFHADPHVRLTSRAHTETRSPLLCCICESANTAHAHAKLCANPPLFRNRSRATSSAPQTAAWRSWTSAS